MMSQDCPPGGDPGGGNNNGNDQTKKRDNESRYYYDHAVERMNQRGITPSQVEEAIRNPAGRPVSGESRNFLVRGRNGINVVVDPEGRIVSVWD